jgi:hypothetical protein
MTVSNASDGFRFSRRRSVGGSTPKATHPFLPPPKRWGEYPEGDPPVSPPSEALGGVPRRRPTRFSPQRSVGGSTPKGGGGSSSGRPSGPHDPPYPSGFATAVLSSQCRPPGFWGDQRPLRRFAPPPPTVAPLPGGGKRTLASVARGGNKTPSPTSPDLPQRSLRSLGEETESSLRPHPRVADQRPTTNDQRPTTNDQRPTTNGLVDRSDLRLTERIQHTTEILGQWGRHADLLTADRVSKRQ